MVAVVISMAGMLYWEFVLLFVLAPVLVLGALSLRGRPVPRPYEAGIGLLVFVAICYTAPWEHYLIGRGVWGYGPPVLGRIWLVPVEEYAFMVLQTILVGLWIAQFRTPVDEGDGVTWGQRAVGAGIGLLVTSAGLAMLTVDATTYLGAILAWSGPVFALQWGFAWPVLARNWRRVLPAIAVPTLYLGTVDRYAIETGIWSISGQYTTGITVLGLPVEEGAFFLVTTAFVVQGLVLLAWAWDRYGIGAWFGSRWPAAGTFERGSR